MHQYVLPVISNNAFDIYHFTPEISEHEAILDLIEEIYSSYVQKKAYHELTIQRKSLKLWTLFHALTEDYRNNLGEKSSSLRLKSMLLYINEHYMNKLSLDEIAKAGLCSTRECNRTFRDELHTTPFTHLLQVRLQKAAELLLNTTMPITMISSSCGFSGSSYFTKEFSSEFGCTPKEYRTR